MGVRDCDAVRETGDDEEPSMTTSTIDVHTHIISKTYIDAIKKAGITE